MIHWQSFPDFIAMGGYAGYVWGSFGVAAVILALEPWAVARRRRLAVIRLKRMQRADARAGLE